MKSDLASPLRPTSPDSAPQPGTDLASVDDCTKVDAEDPSKQSRSTININVSVSVDSARHRADSHPRPDRDENLQYGIGQPSAPVQYSRSPALSATSLDRSSASSPSPPLPPPKNYYPQQPEQIVMNAYPSHEYAYAPYYNSRYAQPYPPSHQYAPPYAASTYAVPGSPMNEIRPVYSQPQSYQPTPNSHVVHTDDAATKLTDRVRRKCYNCRTTDTSTWRRSNLTPGKVLCNKCGLFERTHLRPRPEQFPHKRGPMSAAITKSRSSPSAKVSPLAPNSHTPSYNPSMSPPSMEQHYDGTPRQMHQREYVQNTLPGIQHYTNSGGSHQNSPLSPPMPLSMSRDAMSAGQGIDRSPELTLPSLSRSSSPPLHHIQHTMSYSNNRDRL
jgi:hypothetical protein